MLSPPIITFSSDFGYEGPYVGAVKGVILGICPHARIVDISHEIPSHSILEGAANLVCSYSFFPKDTIHLAVVDPGVGSLRRGIVVCTERYRFVGPDNGLFTLVCQRERVRRVISIESEIYYRKPVSNTFHGRDIFGPVAARLAQGTAPESLGSEVTDYSRLSPSLFRRVQDDRYEGLVLQIDRFGNVITSISDRELKALLRQESTLVTFWAGGTRINHCYRIYAEAPPGKIFYLEGSSGYYELAVSGQSAAQLLNLKVGDPINVTVG